MKPSLHITPFWVRF